MNIRGLSLICLSIFSPVLLAAPISFEDQSDYLSMSGTSETWGLTWTDINNDGWPDLFIQGHRDYPRIFRNTGSGGFEDVANEYDPNELWMSLTYDDKHGVSTADIDNDGDQDILVSVSASGEAQLLINQVDSGQKFNDIASSAGVEADDNARMGIWFDLNNDGLLDLHQHYRTGSFVRLRNNGGITYDTVGTNLCAGGDHGQLIDINNDGHLDYMCGRQGTFPAETYDISSGEFSLDKSLNSFFPAVGNVNNSITGDFNNDLKTDIILNRGALRPSGAAKIDDYSIDAWLLGGTTDVGFEFEGVGEIEFTVDHHPMGLFATAPSAVLNTNGNTNAILGTATISYSSSTGKWSVEKGSSLGMYIRVRAVNELGTPEMKNLRNIEVPTAAQHLVNTDAGFVVDNSTGLAAAVDCVSAVAVDFDNDMDLDLYMACQRGVSNYANRYFDNQGDGTFVEVFSHGGEGPVGSGLETGVADSVAAADYDVDGFVDLAVTNGLLWYPIGLGGPYTLLRNKGNTNNWIEIDLAGVASNRDGIGAKVYATAGGVTQLREQNGGYSRWTQGGHRIHFGLGTNTEVDITVEWPSGQVDSFVGVSANTLYEAQEGATAMTSVVLGPEVRTVVENGDECGEPPYEETYGPAITMWKECGTGDDWRIRFNSGLEDEAPIPSVGSIQGDDAFLFASGVSLAGDLLSLNPSDLLSFDIGVVDVVAPEKGINLNTGDQSSSCMEFTEQGIARIIVGGAQKRIAAPFDLVTLDSCGAPSIDPISDTEACGQPDYDKATEQALFVWKDCDGSDSWHIRATGGGDASGIDFTGSIASTGSLSFQGFNIESSDTLDNSDPDLLSFNLRVWNSGQDGIDFVPASNACLTSTADAPVYLGQNRVPLPQSTNLTTLQECGDSIDPVVIDCGEPIYDRTSEPGFYVWKNCGATGSEETWTFVAASGGLSYGSFIGKLASSQQAVVEALGSSIENTDVLDADSSDTNIDFTLNVGGTGIDGIQVTFPSSSETCLDISRLLPGVSVLFGPDKQVMSGPFNLRDLGACQ